MLNKWKRGGGLIIRTHIKSIWASSRGLLQCTTCLQLSHVVGKCSTFMMTWFPIFLFLYSLFVNLFVIEDGTIAKKRFNTWPNKRSVSYQVVQKNHTFLDAIVWWQTSTRNQVPNSLKLGIKVPNLLRLRNDFLWKCIIEYYKLITIE